MKQEDGHWIDDINLKSWYSLNTYWGVQQACSLPWAAALLMIINIIAPHMCRHAHCTIDLAIVQLYGILCDSVHLIILIYQIRASYVYFRCIAHGNCAASYPERSTWGGAERWRPLPVTNQHVAFERAHNAITENWRPTWKLWLKFLDTWLSYTRLCRHKKFTILI